MVVCIHLSSVFFVPVPTSISPSRSTQYPVSKDQQIPKNEQQTDRFVDVAPLKDIVDDRMPSSVLAMRTAIVGADASLCLLAGIALFFVPNIAANFVFVSYYLLYNTLFKNVRKLSAEHRQLNL
uniref:G_PROTEIN_RECEP_F1_2 domain-containing protein n=1 Tax=Syphacia muris TaxID=451379 RepID=A0A0N5AQM7_9BILA